MPVDRYARPIFPCFAVCYLGSSAFTAQADKQGSYESNGRPLLKLGDD
jgi:hypothetical protein